ncbi:outer membrane lipoprotein-sorting protein [Sphingomonas zeicaulis]|uniref:LolA family protein n=1 Tax=Sphingomonas zeicaulis TaxID=1632740 RepID=UPI003D1AAAB0
MTRSFRFVLALGSAGVVLAPLAFSTGAIAQQAPAAEGIAQVQAHMKAVQTMTAGFSQTDRAGRTVTGTMTLKRPGKVRFAYQKGVDTLVVADGKSLYFIDYSVKQLSRWPIGNSPLAVLLNPDKDLTRVAKVVPGVDPRLLLVEARDPKRPEFGAITLAFARNPSAPAGLMLQGWVAIDSQNNRTTVRLTDQKFNGPVADSAFKFKDPRPQGPRMR